MKEVSDELSKKELEDLAHLLKIDMKSKETKKTLVAKINDKIEELNEVANHTDSVFEVEVVKAPKLTHSTGELMDDVRKVGFKGYHPVTGKPL